MTSKNRKGRYTIRFERLIQEVAYVEVEAESFAQALDMAEESEDMEWEWDDQASPSRVYNVESPAGTTFGFSDIGRKLGFRLDYEDLRDFIPDVARVEQGNAAKQQAERLKAQVAARPAVRRPTV